MLFHNSNQTFSKHNVPYKNQVLNIVNHFIPFSEKEIGISDRFESDFMVQFIKKLNISQEAKDVMNDGLEMYKKYFNLDIDSKTKDKYNIDNINIGWWQLGKVLQDHYGKSIMTEFRNSNYLRLKNKLKPQIIEYGFIKP